MATFDIIQTKNIGEFGFENFLSLLFNPKRNNSHGNYFGMVKDDRVTKWWWTILLSLLLIIIYTSVKDKGFREKLLWNIINFLALGMDIEKSTFGYNTMLKRFWNYIWILSNHTSMGLLERAHSYKDKTSRGISASHGLFHISFDGCWYFAIWFKYCSSWKRSNTTRWDDKRYCNIV